ncbi:MAG: carboxylating nicotinate-nucleotide diphosphorylase [candidate division Zixibacteria bacterium]|nr:carboxylating nicotinate-nucleotide diphosphorylase [candidate division Zixibacteria bacterium]
MKVNNKVIAEIVTRALTEDLGQGDITTLAIEGGKRPARAIIRAKQEQTVCGHQPARAVFRHISPKTRYSNKIGDGKTAYKGDMVAIIDADLQTLLSGERTALNFMMHLSGIATLSARFARQIEGTRAEMLDTRKTLPGMRLLEKYAVNCGGAKNHRIGLFDMYLIKDNHIETAGSIENAIENCLAHRGRKKTKIEVETKTFDQIKRALKYKIDRIMLDNMTVSRIKKAVELIRSEHPGLEIEASGNVSLRTVRKIAQTGVDYISAGALTHSAPAVDLSMEIELK